MDARGFFLAIRRQWVVFLAAAIVIGILAILLANLIFTDTYQVKSSVIVAQASDSNPYAGSEGANVMLVQITSDAVRAEFEERGLEPDFEVIERPNSALLTIQATSTSSDMARATVEAVVAEMESTIETSQDAADIPTDDRAILRVIVAPDFAVQVGDSTAGTIVFVVIAIILSTVLAVVVDQRRMGKGPTPGSVS